MLFSAVPYLVVLQETGTSCNKVLVVKVLVLEMYHTRVTGVVLLEVALMFNRWKPLAMGCQSQLVLC